LGQKQDKSSFVAVGIDCDLLLLRGFNLTLDHGLGRQQGLVNSLLLLCVLAELGRYLRHAGSSQTPFVQSLTDKIPFQSTNQLFEAWHVNSRGSALPLSKCLSDHLSSLSQDHV
jgi:hypothetical protein